MKLLQAKVSKQNSGVTQQPLCLLCYVTITLLNWDEVNNRYTLKSWFKQNTEKKLTLLLSYLFWNLAIHISLFFYLLRFWEIFISWDSHIHHNTSDLCWMKFNFSDLFTVLRHPSNSFQRKLMIVPVEIIHTRFCGLSTVTGTWLYKKTQRCWRV